MPAVCIFHRPVVSLLRLRIIAASYPLASVTKVCIGVLPRTCFQVFCHSQSNSWSCSALREWFYSRYCCECLKPLPPAPSSGYFGFQGKSRYSQRTTHADAICLFSLALECATFALTMVSIRQFHVYSNWREYSPIVRVICRDGKRSFLIDLSPRANVWLRGFIFSCRWM